MLIGRQAGKKSVIYNQFIFLCASYILEDSIRFFLSILHSDTLKLSYVAMRTGRCQARRVL